MTDANKLLAELIETSGLTKAEVARRVGVRPQAVTNWTGGQARPSRDHLGRLEDVLDVRPRGRLLHAYGHASGDGPEPTLTIEDAIRADRRISPEDKRVLLAIVERFTRNR